MWIERLQMVKRLQFSLFTSIFLKRILRAFKDEKSKIEISINHVTYTHATTLQDDTKNELIGDLINITYLPPYIHFINITFYI